MKKLLIIFFAVLLFVPVLAAAGTIKKDLSEIINKTPEANVSVIILFYERPNVENIDDIRKDNANIKYQFNIIDGVAASLPAKSVEKISNRAFVKLIEPDYKTEALLDYSTKQIQADKVWELNTTGKGVDVAIIDTGIHDEHPTLSVAKEIDYTGEGSDDLNGHGTHVAGIVASADATYRGAAFGANLFNVKVLNQYGSGYGSDVIEGIEWAVNNGAEIISLSLGAKIEPCDGTDAISLAVDNAVAKGVTAVVAAGNFGPESGTITSPGCSKKAITVGAVDDQDIVPSWSSRGPTADDRVKPDLVAPGANIKSTSKDNNFVDMSGTSMSTPHVSGVVALLLSRNTNLLPSDILQILKNTAVDLGYDANTQGSGRVNAYKAFLYVDNITGEEPKLPSPGLLPDNPFYAFKKFGERIRLWLTFDPQARVRLRLQVAEMRLAELNTTMANGQYRHTEMLRNEYENEVMGAFEEINATKALGRNATLLAEHIFNATYKHTLILKGVLEKVPEQAKPAIEGAINVSMGGQENALDRLGEDMPERSAELHFRFAEKILLRARENAREGNMEEAENLIIEYEKNVNKSQSMIEKAKEAGTNAANVAEIVTAAASKHLEVLQEVYERVPEEARYSIEKTMNVSAQWQAEVSESLKKISSEGEVNGQQPSGVEEIKETKSETTTTKQSETGRR